MNPSHALARGPTAAFCQENPNPNVIRLRVVDESGAPVEGARLGTHANRFKSIMPGWLFEAD